MEKTAEEAKWAIITIPLGVAGKVGKWVGGKAARGARNAWRFLRGGGDEVAKTAARFVNLPTKGRKYNQIGRRGWTEESIQGLVNTPHTTRSSVNKETGNSATAYFNKDGSHIIVDDVTGDIVQLSDQNNVKDWIPDDSIVDPYVPE